MNFYTCTLNVCNKNLLSNQVVGALFCSKLLTFISSYVKQGSYGINVPYFDLMKHNKNYENYIRIISYFLLYTNFSSFMMPTKGRTW